MTIITSDNYLSFLQNVEDELGSGEQTSMSQYVDYVHDIILDEQ